MKNKLNNSLIIHKAIFIFVLAFIAIGFIFNLGVVGSIVGSIAGSTTFMLILVASANGILIENYKNFIIFSLISAFCVIAYTDYEGSEWVAKLGIIRDTKYYFHFIWNKIISFLIIAHLVHFIKIKFFLK